MLTATYHNNFNTKNLTQAQHKKNARSSLELTNHLSNVLAVVSDKKTPVISSTGTLQYYKADVLQAQDYYPFGSVMRKWLTPTNTTNNLRSTYTFGFNGKEDDKETQTQDYGMRIYDYRLGRFLSVDPLTKSYPFYTPYQFAGNTPIAAVDLDGEEPKIVVTNQVTGYTEIKVYGAGNVQTMVVETFKAIVQYTDDKGVTTEIATFNVTRDGWYDMGTDANGNTILCNRSSDPAPGAGKVFIQSSSSQQYGQGTPSFTMSPILSPIDQDCNQNFYDNGQAGDPLPPEVIRTNNTAQGAQFHVGGYYEQPNGNISLGGTYGCYGVVDPTQVSPTNTPTTNPVTSNGEMQRFGNAVQSAQSMQIKEHKKSAKVEVEIQPRTHEKTKTVSP
jgi:RHS repeat-associated protein